MSVEHDDEKVNALNAKQLKALLYANKFRLDDSVLRKAADLLYKQDISGSLFLKMKKEDFKEIGLTLGCRDMLVTYREELRGKPGIPGTQFEITQVNATKGDEVLPMEVEGLISTQSSKGLCHNPKSLSMILLVGNVYTLICCGVWIWYYKQENKRYNDGGQFPAGETKIMVWGLVTFIAIVCTTVILAGCTAGVLAGSNSVYRGWLQVTIIGQICLINTIHFGIWSWEKSSDAALKIITTFLLLCSFFTTWTAWRTSEKIQEEQLEKQRLLGKESFMLNVGLDLPDMTVVGIEKAMIGCSMCLILFGLVFIIMGCLVDLDRPYPYRTSWHLITCGGTQITAGVSLVGFRAVQLGRSRIALTISMMLAIAAMIMICTMAGWLSMMREFFAYECGSFVDVYGVYSTSIDCAHEERLTTAEVFFHYLSLVLTASQVWLSWRLSERVQTKARYDAIRYDAASGNTFSLSVSVFSKPHTLLGAQVDNPYNFYRRSLRVACFFMFAAGCGFFYTWSAMGTREYYWELQFWEGVDDDSLSPFILGNIMNGILNIAAVGFSYFGVSGNYRGVLRIGTLLFLTCTGYNYYSFLGEYALWAMPLWWNRVVLDDNWIKEVARISSISRLLTIFSSWIGAICTYVLAEILKEREQISGDGSW